MIMRSSTKPLIVIAAVAFVIAVPVYETVREWCRLEPRRRPWLVAGAIGSLALVAIVAPGIGKLSPPLSESPAGLFVVLAKAAALGLLAVVALATLLAAAKSAPPDRSDPAA